MRNKLGKELWIMNDPKKLKINRHKERSKKDDNRAMERNVKLEENGTIKTNTRKYNNAWISGIWNVRSIQGKRVEIVGELEKNELENGNM